MPLYKFDLMEKYDWKRSLSMHSQPAFTCSKLIIEKLEQGVEYVQSYQ